MSFPKGKIQMGIDGPFLSISIPFYPFQPISCKLNAKSELLSEGLVEPLERSTAAEVSIVQNCALVIQDFSRLRDKQLSTRLRAFARLVFWTPLSLHVYTKFTPNYASTCTESCSALLMTLSYLVAFFWILQHTATLCHVVHVVSKTLQNNWYSPTR